MNNIIHVSGLIDHLTPVKARPATKAELRLVHTAEHIENIQVRLFDAFCTHRCAACHIAAR
jgi:acetoin utilization deacetylase AcuC-like enzyme